MKTIIPKVNKSLELYGHLEHHKTGIMIRIPNIIPWVQDLLGINMILESMITNLKSSSAEGMIRVMKMILKVTGHQLNKTSKWI